MVEGGIGGDRGEGGEEPPLQPRARLNRYRPRIVKWHPPDGRKYFGRGEVIPCRQGEVYAVLATAILLSPCTAGAHCATGCCRGVRVDTAGFVHGTAALRGCDA